MAGDALLFAGASAGLDLLSGLFGYFASEEAAATAESRGRMLRLEADAEATRYGEQARNAVAQTKLAFLKSGVTLSGSPLDVLDADMLTAQENINAIRAKGAADQLDAQNMGAQALMGGRNALLKGVASGAGKIAWASYQSGKNTKGISQAEKNVAFEQGSLYSPGVRGGWGGGSSVGSIA